MLQSKGVSKFMGGSCPVKSARKQRNTSIFIIPTIGHTLGTSATSTNCIYSIVNDDEVNIVRREEIKHLSNIGNHSTKRTVKIVAIGMLPIHAVNQRFALGIGFKAEGHVPMSVCPHLIAVKGLNVADLIFHFLNDLGAMRPVIGQEVDHPHGARFAHV